MSPGGTAPGGTLAPGGGAAPGVPAGGGVWPVGAVAGGDVGPAARRSARRRNLDEGVTVESRRRRIGILRGELVDADVLGRQLDQDLELDRHQVVAPNSLGPPRGHEGFELRELVAAERLSGISQYLLGLLDGLGVGSGRGSLRRSHGRLCNRTCRHAERDDQGRDRKMPN